MRARAKAFKSHEETVDGRKMARYDVVDEGIIDADCATVFKAYANEFGGITHVWMPIWESQPRGSDTTVQKGTVADITVHYKGTTKFAARITEFVKDKLFTEEFFEGDYTGTGEWTFEPLDGKTKVRLRWKATTNSRSLTLAALFIDIGKRHSELVHELFKAWNRHLRQSKNSKL